MEGIIERMMAVVRENNGDLDLKYLLNPELLDKYFYPELKKKKHHICCLREYLDNDLLFETIINDFLIKTIILDPEIREEILMVKERKETCSNCSLDCVNQIHPTFDLVSYFIIANIKLRYALVDKVVISELIINCLNQFSLEGMILSYDYKKMIAFFTDYDLRSINKTLSKNSTLINLDFLTKLCDKIETIEIEFSNLSNGKIKKGSIQKLVNNKEKFYNKRLILDEKLKELKKNKPEIPFKLENNFDRVDGNRVYNYFKENLFEKGYLSKEDLEKFLLIAFQDKLIPNGKFSFIKLDIGKITNTFYTYFVEIASKPHGEKQKYAELLGNYFNGFETEKVKNNFARYY